MRLRRRAMVICILRGGRFEVLARVSFVLALLYNWLVLAGSKLAKTGAHFGDVQ